MKKINKFLSVLLVISMILSPVSLLLLELDNVVYADNNALENAVQDFKSHYIEDVKEYNFLETMTLKSLEVDSETIQKNLKIEELSFKDGNSYEDSSSKEYDKAIMGIIGAGFDPEKYNEKDYIDFLVKSQTEEGYFETKEDSGDKAEDIAYSILALDMVGAEYDTYKAVKLLESKFTIEGDKAFVKEYEFYSSGDLSLTAISLIALSSHKEIINYDLINKAINYIESERFDSGMYGGTDWSGKEIISGKLTSQIVQALISVGVEIPGQTIDGLLELQENHKFKENQDSGDATAEVFAALTDVYIKKSMFKEISSEIGNPNIVKIVLSGDSNELKIGKEIQLLGKAYDANNKYDSSQSYIWSSSDSNIAIVDENTGIVKGINPGTVDITVKVKGFENIKQSIEINVVGVEPNSIDIEIDENLSEIEVGKKTKINSIVLDAGEEIVENANVVWEISPKDAGELNESGIFTALKPGDTIIKATVKKNNDKRLSKSVELRIINRDARINEALEEVKDGLVENTDKYDYTTAMALNLMGIDEGHIASKVNKYSKYSSNSNTRAKDIMMAMAIGKDPKDYDGRNYVQELLDGNFYDEKNPEWIANAVIALDMAGEKYDESKAIKSLINKLTKSSGKYYIKYTNGNPDNENTALTLIALSKHRDIDGVEDAISGIKNHFKSIQNDDALIDNCKGHSFAIQGLIASGEDIYSDEWTKADMYGNKVNVLDALLSLKVEDGFKATPNMGWAKPGEEVFAFAALSDLSRNSSMYYEFHQSKPKKFTIEIQEELKNINLDQGETIELKAQVFEDGNPVNNEIIWESLDDGIAEVKDGIIKGLKEGETKVRAKIKYFEDIYDEANIKVNKIIGKPNKIIIKELENMSVLKGDKFKVYANVFDSNENKLENIKINWESSNSDIISIDENGNVIVNDTGSVEIIAKINDTEIQDRITIIVFQNQEEADNTIDKFVDRVKDYYETIHFVENQSSLDAWETATFTRAGFSLEKWYVNKNYQPAYDMNLKYLGNKATQAFIMLDIGENPTNYKGRNLIEEIVQEINKPDYGHSNQSYLKAVIAVDKYNEKYKNQKISYDENVVINNILLAQTQEGGFKERGDFPVPINTGYALKVLSRHRNFSGVEESIGKAIEYLHSVQKDDGAFYTGTYVTGNNAEIISGLLSIGEDLTSDKWTKGDMNPIESMFILWNDEGSFDNQEGESINNRGWITATQRSLYTLIDLKEAGYSNYIVSSKIPSEKPEESMNIEILFDRKEIEVGEEILLKTEVKKGNEILSGKEIKWLSSNPEVATVDENGKLIGHKEGKVSIKVALKEDDKINNTIELSVVEKNKDFEIETIGKESLINGRQANLKYKITNPTNKTKKASFIIGLYDSKTNKLINYSLTNKNFNPKEEIEVETIFLIPVSGEYYIKRFISK